MLQGEVPSDLDQHEIGWGQAAGRRSILSDLDGEFQGAAGAYGILAVLIPGFMLAAARYGWTDRSPEFLIFGAGVLFIALAAVSLYVLVWFFWARKRLNAVYKRMDLLAAEMKGGKRPHE